MAHRAEIIFASKKEILLQFDNLKSNLIQELEKWSRSKTLASERQGPVKDFIAQAVLAVNILNQQVTLLEENITDQIKKAIVSVNNQTDSVTKTYADAVRVTEQKADQKKLETIIITNDDKDKRAEDIQKELEANINPRKLGVKINNLIKTKNNKVVLKVPSADQAETITKEINKRANLSARHQINKLKLILFNIPKDFEEEEVLEALHQEGDFKLVKIFPGRETSNNWIIEGPTAVALQVLKSKRVFIRFRAWGIRRYAQITRCFKCQGLGHRATTCSMDPVCARCANPHATDVCQEMGENKCHNCITSNRHRGTKFRTDHPAFVRSCPVQRETLQTLITGNRPEPQMEKEVAQSQELEKLTNQYSQPASSCSAASKANTPEQGEPLIPTSSHTQPKNRRNPIRATTQDTSTKQQKMTKSLATARMTQ